MASVTASAADVTAFSYVGAEPGRPAPLRSPSIQLFRDLHSALDGTWQVCIIRVERDSHRGAAEFVPPGEAATWHEYWLAERMRWYTDLGLRSDRLRLRAHGAEELSHYSSATSDIEYLFPMGWSELEGIANRGDFDLRQHAEFSGEKLEYFDQATSEAYVPHVIEPAGGVDRAAMAFIIDAYDVEEVEGRTRTVLRLHPRLAPVKAAVLPLVSRDGMPEKARMVYDEVRRRVQAEFDEGGSIGRRYRRQDEIGTPWGITVDGQTMEDGTVTLRDRDTLEQTRVPIEGLGDLLADRLEQPWTTPKAVAA